MNKNIKLFYISKFFTGLRFFIPIWILWGGTFLNVSGQSNLEGVAFAITLLCELPSGALADLIGRKWCVAFGWLIIVLSHIGMGISNSAMTYIIWNLVSGFGTAFVSGADTALIFDTLKEYGKEKEFASIQGKGIFLFRISIILASFAGGFLYKISPAFPYILMGVAETVAIVCFIMMREPSIDTAKFTIQSYISQLRMGVLEAFKTRYIRYISLFYALVGGITVSSLWFFSYTYAKELGLGESGQSILFGFTGILKAISALILSRLIKKLNKNFFYILISVLIILIYLPSFWAPPSVAVLIICATETVASGRFIVLDQFVNEEFVSKVRATALSFLNMFVSLVYVVILIGGGYIVNQHSTAFLYTLLGFVSLLLVLPLSLLIIRQGNKAIE